MTDKKAELYRCGKELFRSKGFKDTNIAEITKMAGMATGTFYNYYPSKDKLFMEIYIEENIKLKKSIMGSIDLEAGPVTVMKEMISKNLQGMSADPILQQWYNRDVFNRIEQCYREENGSDYVDFLYYGFLDIVRKWQEEGKMRSDIDPEMIMAIFSAIVSVDTHKEEIGLQYFPRIMDYLGEFTMKGLTDCTASG